MYPNSQNKTVFYATVNLQNEIVYVGKSKYNMSM